MAPYKVQIFEAMEVVDSAPFPSRHTPIRLRCRTPDGHLELCMVKLCRSKNTATACISELLSTLALKSGSAMTTLDPVFVQVSDEMYRSLTKDYKDPARNVGLHFGTLWNENALAGPVRLDSKLVNWTQLLYLYVFDTWLKNGDRETDGNVLVKTLANKLVIIPADHSDCFGGVSTFSSGKEAVKRSKVKIELAVSGATLDQIIVKAQTSWKRIVEVGRGKCVQMAETFESSLRIVPEGWIIIADFDPSFIAEVQKERASQLLTILKPELYEEAVQDSQGGLLLKLDGDDNGSF